MGIPTAVVVNEILWFSTTMSLTASAGASNATLGLSSIDSIRGHSSGPSVTTNLSRLSMSSYQVRAMSKKLGNS